MIRKDLTLDWFRDHVCGVGARDAHAAWHRWLKRNPHAPERRKVEKLLEVSTRVAPTTVRSFLDLHGSRFSGETWDRLYRISSSVGWTHVKKRPDTPPRRRRLGQIAFLTERDVPSLRYHWTVLHSVLASANDSGIIVTPHQVSPG